MKTELRHKNFIDRDKLYSMIEGEEPKKEDIDKVLKKALKMKGLNLEEVAMLLRVENHDQIMELMQCAKTVKEEIYGKRLVLFTPIYTGNACINNCTYCSFRKDNKLIKRKVLSMDEIQEETRSLLDEGHKRVLLICGESKRNDIDYMVEAIRKTYATLSTNKKDSIRRINVELAPMSVEDFKKIKEEKIGTYVCFQETYDPIKYKEFHPAGTPKADYLNRLTVMDRAMEAGIDDVGIGALFGLTDYRFEVLAIMEHAKHLEEAFGVGPHTVSVPRIEYAVGAPHSENIPAKVDDYDFKKIVAIIRLALPYTGIILSTRENDDMRNELIEYGVEANVGIKDIDAFYNNTPDTHIKGIYASLNDNLYMIKNKGDSFNIADSSYVDIDYDKILEKYKLYDEYNRPVIINGKEISLYDIDYSVEANTTYFHKDEGLTDLKKVYFIVSNRTASASELLINILKPYMDVQVIGVSEDNLSAVYTYGKPVGSFGIPVDQFDLYLGMYELKNANRENNYFKGIKADISLNDDTDIDFGIQDDPAIAWILGMEKKRMELKANSKIRQERFSFYFNTDRLIGNIKNRSELKIKLK